MALFNQQDDYKNFTPLKKKTGTVHYSTGTNLPNFPATTFLELWKRKQAVVAWEWDLQNVEDEEEPRPEFEATVTTFRTNPVTRRKEPYIPAWNKLLRFTATGSMVFFMVLI